MISNVNGVTTRPFVANKEPSSKQLEISDENPLQILFDPRVGVRMEDLYSPQLRSPRDLGRFDILIGSIQHRRVFNALGLNWSHRFCLYSLRSSC
jgi:hypothetical protein